MIYGDIDGFEPNQHVAIITALNNLVPACQYAFHGDDLENLVWDDERPRPTDNEIMSEVEQVWASWNATEYQRQRKDKYPPIEDYLDGIVKGDQAQIDEYIAACQAVKGAHPKPAENDLPA